MSIPAKKRMCDKTILNKRKERKMKHLMIMKKKKYNGWNIFFYLQIEILIKYVNSSQNIKNVLVLKDLV